MSDDIAVEAVPAVPRRRARIPSPTPLNPIVERATHALEHLAAPAVPAKDAAPLGPTKSKRARRRNNARTARAALPPPASVSTAPLDKVEAAMAAAVEQTDPTREEKLLRLRQKCSALRSRRVSAKAAAPPQAEAGRGNMPTPTADRIAAATQVGHKLIDDMEQDRLGPKQLAKLAQMEKVFVEECGSDVELFCARFNVPAAAMPAVVRAVQRIKDGGASKQVFSDATKDLVRSLDGAK